MKISKGLAAIVVALVLVGGATVAGGGSTTGRLTLAAAGVALDSTEQAAKSASGKIARTDPSLLGRTDSTALNVLIKYDYDATASYAGDVAGLAATSPAVTGKKLEANRNDVVAYERHAASASRAITAAVEAAVPAADVRTTFTTVYGGVAATVPASSVADLLKVDGVVAVQKDSLQQPQTDATPEFTGASAVWPSLGGSTTAASNVVVGVLDTGVWPEHPSFANLGLPPPPGGPYGCEFGDGSDVAHLGPAFSCNGKLVGAYAFLDTYLDVLGSEPGEYCNDATGECSARDSNGHGTHTASTAAGSPVANAPIYGIERGPISGMAPGARVIMYRVCLEEGCFGSDSIAAVEQAILDGIDVINFSIAGGANPYMDGVELAFLDAFNAGISVNASAGNSGPGAATADHGGPWVTTVGASTSPRAHTSTVQIVASNGDTLALPGATITPGAGPAPIVLATEVGVDALCVNPIAAGAATGKIVACQRGPNRILKGFNVMNGGGAGMVLYNPIKQDVMTDNHWVPSVHVDGPSSIVAFLTSHTGETASWAAGVKSARPADVMTSFSSRGPLGDFVKPDVTAPGVQILAGMTPTPVSPAGGPPGELFQAIAGTSMSSPHSAGASAVVKAAHPNWTPAMIKSALMTSASQDVLDEDGVTHADPFDSGAGSIRVNRAVSPTLVFDETAANFAASADDPLHRIDLNLASINATTMTGTITTKRTAINVSGIEQELEVRTEAPPGVTIAVSDDPPDASGAVKAENRIHASESGTTEIWITIAAPTAANGQYFGEITLDPRRNGFNDVVLPVAFFRKQGDATLAHVCSPTSFPERTGSAHCSVTVANVSNTPADVSLTVTNLDEDDGLDYRNITPPATAIGVDDGVQWTGTLAPNVPPTIDSITPTTGPAGGYLPLTLFGTPPIGGMGDETIVNFNVPSFFYGREAYTRIGVTSNGYVVIGGGTSEDVEFEPQKPLPNTARPNNVVAPLWTDLNPAFGGAIRINVLTDGVDSWIVVDYAAVRNYGDTTTHTFELWFRIAGGGAGSGPASEQITITLGAANTAMPDAGSGGNTGAENRTGTSGQNLTTPANNTEWAVNTSPPQAGETRTFEFDVSAKKAGTYHSVAAMTTNVTPGTTQVVQTLTVTKP